MRGLFHAPRAWYSAAREWGAAVKPIASALFWIAVYLLLVLAPLLVLLIGPLPPGAGLWWDFSMALGFAAMSMMSVQFALTARFRRATAPFGIDIIYFFHRYVGVIAFGLLAAHVAIIGFQNPRALGPADPAQAPASMSAGRLAFALLALLIATSLWRKRLRIEYDYWRVAHALFATAAFLLAVVHITGVGYYTAAPWTRRLWSAYTLSHGLLIVYVRLVKPAIMLRRPYRVVEVRPERGCAWTLAVAPVGHAGLRFAPGQFAWLTLRASPFRLREHPFSFSSDAADSDRVEFTIKDLGDFSAMIKTVQPGETVYLDGPYGVFTVDRHRAAPGFVFIAGGIGIAPIMSMLRTLAQRGERRPLRLIYANNRWDEVVFRDELARLQTRLALTVVHVLGEPPAGWDGEVGYVTEALLDRRLPPERRALEYFLCGPKPMTDTVQRGLRRQGVPLARQHFELFDMA